MAEEKSLPEILPCPKCGSGKIGVPLRAVADQKVFCWDLECGYSGPRRDALHEAILAWNALKREDKEPTPIVLSEGDHLYLPDSPVKYQVVGFKSMPREEPETCGSCRFSWIVWSEMRCSKLERPMPEHPTPENTQPHARVATDWPACLMYRPRKEDA
jgi:hypothetical protein